MPLEPNGLFHADALAVLERLDYGRVTLAYVDPPLPEDTAEPASPEEQESWRRSLTLLCQVLQQVRRILSDKGSLYLHSEPRLAGTVRPILDHLFGRGNFRTEIIWPACRRRRSLGVPHVEHDSIYLYTKTDAFVYNQPERPLAPAEIEERYASVDEHGPYKLADLTAPLERPSGAFEWKGVRPPPGRSWKYSAQRLAALEQEGRIGWGKPGTLPRLKVHLMDSATTPIGNIWDDLIPVYPRSAEFYDYPTQKPLALLERIVLMGSEQGDVVLDPFCGTGTTLVAAHAARRKWIGADLSGEACGITGDRLSSQHGLQPVEGYAFAGQDSIERTTPVIDRTYACVSIGLDPLSPEVGLRCVLNRPLPIEETRHYEFKEIKGKNSIGAITNAADEYVVAFLNSEGGRIFWGVRDSDRAVVGVSLTLTDRDRLRKDVGSKLHTIQPAIDPTQYRLQLYPVHDGGTEVPDLYVVEITVPRIRNARPYFTGGNEAFVRVDGGKKKLTGPELVDWIIRRQSETAAPPS